MSAHVEEQHLYTPACPDCPWWGSETTNEAEAEEEADQHDREQHS
jgi:hypothetical protein